MGPSADIVVEGRWPAALHIFPVGNFAGRERLNGHVVAASLKSTQQRHAFTTTLHTSRREVKMPRYTTMPP
jgi:hypothetical protein